MTEKDKQQKEKIVVLEKGMLECKESNFCAFCNPVIGSNK